MMLLAAVAFANRLATMGFDGVTCAGNNCPPPTVPNISMPAMRTALAPVTQSFGDLGSRLVGYVTLAAPVLLGFALLGAGVTAFQRWSKAAAASDQADRIDAEVEEQMESPDFHEGYTDGAVSWSEPQAGYGDEGWGEGWEEGDYARLSGLAV